MKKYTYIESKPTILGGTPVIVGTRIPVSQLLHLLSQGYSIKQVKQYYPQLSLQTIKGVIATIAADAENGRFYTAE
ncbi:DUF433 domain-containing protein [Candidatus Roizmanbacteria bacterium]|nr:DUF433 domain-containing protein [Candidatus Roizmanbacteria bacterium]